MKKLFSILVVFITVFALSGCQLLEETYTVDQLYTQDEVETLVEQAIANYDVVVQQQFSEYQDQIDQLEPSQLLEFLEYMFTYTDEFTFIELGTVYNTTVESYGYSSTYLLKIEEETTFRFTVNVSKTIELHIYTNYLEDEMETHTVTPSLLGFAREYTITVQPGYLVFEFESWDLENDSDVDFIVTIEEEPTS